MTPEQSRLLQECHEAIMGIVQLLKGYNGTEGFCAEFARHKEEDKAFRKEFYNFRTRIYILIAVAASGGGVVGSWVGRLIG